MTVWQDRAACRGMTHLFYPPDQRVPDGATVRREAMAYGLCQSCPVLIECREWVLTTRPDPCPGGIVAGLSPSFRTRSRSRPRALTNP